MSHRSGSGVSLQTALLGLVGLVLIVAFVPGGAVLERRLGVARGLVEGRSFQGQAFR